MLRTFTAAVRQKGDSYVIDSTVSVYQQVAGNQYAPIAYIYDSADPADHRQTKIHFAGGTLYFSAAYDGPLRGQVIWPFMDEAHKCTDMALHCFPFADQAYLCSSEGFFPITKAYDRGMFELRLYRRTSRVSGEGLHYTAFAKVMQTQRTEHGYMYMLQVEDGVPDSLLMAILSLPFTLNIHS